MIGSESSTGTRRRVILLTLIGVTAFLVALVVHLPAVHAWGWLGGQAPIQVYGIRGTAWDGEADAVIAEGQRLDAVRWQLRPGALLRARLSYDLQGQLRDGRIAGTAHASPSGALRLENVRLDADANTLARQFGSIPVTIGGRLDAFLENVEVSEDGQLTRIRGLVNWNAGSIDMGETVTLGSYALRLDGGGDSLEGQVLDTDAILRLEGDIHLNPDTGDMRGDVVMQARDGAADTLVQTLRFAGIPDPAAENRISFSGNINNPLGFRGQLE